MDIGGTRIEAVDLLIALYFMGFFVLGFAQGTIRRLLGIGSILFSWFLAANIAEPLGQFLGSNWTQFPREYSYMVGFATIFVAASVAFALIIQGFYKPQPLFQKARFADELIGGVLGLLEAAIIYGAILIILDSFFEIPGIPQDPNELPFLREIWGAMDSAQTTRALPRHAHPGVLPVDRPVRPGQHPEELPTPLSVLDRALLERPTLEAARGLIGAHLVRDDATGRRVGRIVEVEAYIGRDDQASHARFGETARNRIMFGPPGHAYVYLVYGMYDCLNVVTEPERAPAAVLIRAVEPLDGIEAMRLDRVVRATARRRSLTPDRAAGESARIASLAPGRLASGPGLVAAAFGLDTGWTGLDLCDPASPLRLETASPDAPAPTIDATPRIGIDYAGEPWDSKPWRFIERGNRSVSGQTTRRRSSGRPATAG